jgi:hypothetical protein
MGKISGIESRAKRTMLTIVLFLVALLVVGNVVGILGASNLVWGEDNQYGIVSVPGKEVLHLPASDVDVSFAVDIIGKGNQTVDVPIPSGLALTVSPVDGPQAVHVTRDLGGSTNANGDGVNSQRRVWRIHVPADGDYRVRARGSFPGAGINPQLWFGHGPPLPGGWPWLVGTVLVAAGWAVMYLIGRRRRGSAPKRVARATPQHSPTATDAEVDRLVVLAAMHRRGDLTDDEYAAEKAKLIGGTRP